MVSNDPLNDNLCAIRGHHMGLCFVLTHLIFHSLYICCAKWLIQMTMAVAFCSSERRGAKRLENEMDQ